MNRSLRKEERWGKTARPSENTVLAFDRPYTVEARQPRMRLDQLYRISKLLLDFKDRERVLADILPIVSESLPLTTTILIEEARTGANVSTWNADGVSSRHLQSARSHAIDAHAYLTGSASALNFETKNNIVGRKHMGKMLPANPGYVVIPMVVRRQPVFGTIQFEGVRRLSEQDLIFVNAIANLLAIALDRQTAWRQELAARAEAEAAEQRMRFLADASRVLAASLDYQSTLDSMARLAVQSFADFCIIDMQSENQPRRRVTLRSSTIPEEFQEDEMERVLAGVAARVLEARRPVIHPEASEDPTAGGKGTRSFGSYLCVPLRINSHAIGTLTLVSIRPDRVYKKDELFLIEDLARRIVTTFENTQVYAAALQAIGSRDDVLRMVSHDLRGPLNVVLGFIKLFLGKPEPKDLVCDRKQVEAIQRSAESMNRLIADLLDSASIDARHLRIEPEACTVQSLIDESTELLGLMAGQKEIRLQRGSAAHLPPVFVDRHRILQVFSNLIGNAIKFTPPGGTITVGACRLDDEIQFSVEDTGKGLADSEIARVFSRFWQAPETARLGTGLGLFISKGIVEGHGGRIWVDSQPGIGSRFNFTLPLSQARLAGTSN